MSRQLIEGPVKQPLPSPQQHNMYPSRRRLCPFTCTPQRTMVHCQLPAKRMASVNHAGAHSQHSYLLLPANHCAVPGRRYVLAKASRHVPIKSQARWAARLRQLDGITNGTAPGCGVQAARGTIRRAFPPASIDRDWQGRTTNSLDGTFHFPSRVDCLTYLFTPASILTTNQPRLRLCPFFASPSPSTKDHPLMTGRT